MKRKLPVPPKIKAALPFLRQHQDFLIFGLAEDETLRCHSTRTNQDRLILLFESATTGKCQLFTPGYRTPADVADRLRRVVAQMEALADAQLEEAKGVPFPAPCEPTETADGPDDPG